MLCKFREHSLRNCKIFENFHFHVILEIPKKGSLLYRSGLAGGYLMYPFDEQKSF